MKRLLICLSFLLLTSCQGLFGGTPQSVINGQRAIYQSVLIAEENDNKIINRYIQDTKAAVTYHINYVFEPSIDAVRKDLNLSSDEKSEQILTIERNRQAKLDAAYVDIERIAEDMRSQAMQHHGITRKLAESIYNYLSVTPIGIDNLDFWIEKMQQVQKR